MSPYKNDILNIFKMGLSLDKLSGCNILITGATGLIGGCLVETLMMNPKRNYHVYASGRNEERALKRFREFSDNPAFHFFQYDVMQPLKSDVNFDYIIHAASNASPNFFANNPVEVMKANIYGVTNLMEYGKERSMKRFLYVSSGEVYGEGDGRVFTEEYSGYVNPTSPRSCYPSVKRAAETLCVSYAAEYDVNVVIARPCHVYGPYFTESDNRVYAQFIRNILRGEDIVLKSSGQQFRSWCYVVDCVSALLHILLKGEKGEAYNIADSSSNLSIRQLAEMVSEIGNSKVTFELSSEEERLGFNPVGKSVFSTRKLQDLGWSITGMMKEKMLHTIVECKNNSI